MHRVARGGTAVTLESIHVNVTQAGPSDQTLATRQNRRFEPLRARTSGPRKPSLDIAGPCNL